MPQPKFAVPRFTIKVESQPLTEDFNQKVVEIVVDSDMYQPSMFTILVHDNDMSLVDSEKLAIGKALEVIIEPPEQGNRAGSSGKDTLIKGEITALEPTFGADSSAVLLVRGYDKSHRLHRGRKTRTFLKIKDSDLVQKIAGEADLSASVDPTSVTFDYVLQNNQTNIEFLRERAQRIGYQLYVEDEKLYFKKGTANAGQGPELVWKESLVSFRPRLTAVQQTDSAVVTGWDPLAKQAIVGTSSPPSSANQGGVTTTGGAQAKNVFGGAAEVAVVSYPVATTSEADALAQAMNEQVNSAFVQAEGVCFGEPRITAGKIITIKGVGTRFSGKYMVTSATHVLNTGSGYSTTFTISGRHSYTLTHLLAEGNGHVERQGRVRGVVVGLVTNINDPDGMGRIKVKFPWLPTDGGAEIESTWARIAAPMSGKERGFFFLPEVDDEVLVAFEHDDPRFPYIVGGLWNKKDTPPLTTSDAVASGKVKQRIIKSTSGHVIILDDTSGSEKITIQDKTGKNDIIITSSDNSMLIETDNEITIKAKKTITVKGEDINMSGKNVTVKTQQDFKVEATGKCDLKGTSGMTLDGTSQTVLKGAQVQVDGSAMTEVKGGIVKIN